LPNDVPGITLGAVFLPQLPPERLREVARAADDAGLDELWLWEDCFYGSGIASAAAALAWTQQLRVCVGVLPVPLRNVALTAMEVATLNRLFGPRLGIGVGHGVQDWMGQVGARVESPITLLTEYLDALRALLAGERVTVEGRYVRLDDVGLDWPPVGAGSTANPAVPIHAGATGPKSLRLAGAHADGVILTGGTSPDQVRAMVSLVAEGRAAAGRSGTGRVVVYVHAATGPDAAARLEIERRRWGYESMTDVAASGDAATVAEAVQRWVEAGADTVVLQPTPDDPDPEGFIRFVAEQVRPLLP
jgi:alkanesulfonate monooxygenase SsuD/methylene tetrahydromethanopterin reductase-like flavin-dependent oxidoreductase (luciferase family)